MKLAWLMWLATILPPQAADQTCLATMVYLEARSESSLGQMAVAEVALRRRETGRWGRSVCQVVSAPNQFALSTTNKNYVLRNPVAWEEAWKIAGRAMQIWNLPSSERPLVVPHADHFVAGETEARWIKGPPLTTIGAHSFYRIN